MRYCKNQTDHGPDPYVVNVANAAMYNSNFRTAIWTGRYAQMTLMYIPVCSEIGMEVHNDADQIIRIEEGNAQVKMGCSRNLADYQENLCKGDAVFVPAGTWHNIINIGRVSLKVSTIYAPPHHPAGTIHRTRADAEREY